MKCDAKTKKGKQCKNNAKEGTTKCGVHNRKKKKAKVKKPHKPEKDCCPLCGEEETWESMEYCGYPNYELSSLGKCWSSNINMLLKQTIGIDGYIYYRFTNIDHQTKGKGVHTWQGSAFFGLSLLYGDDAKITKDLLTMDHINGVKHQNYTCCNLIPATFKQQNTNKEHKFSGCNGKIVLRLSLDGQFDQKYQSIVQAAREMETTEWIMTNRCDNNIPFKGYRFRYLTKEDLEEQKWLSTSDLYPDYAPLEVSEEGYILRANGVITKGFEHIIYYATGWNNIKENAYYRKLVHDIIWSVFHDQLIPTNLEIGHKNRDGKDNHIDNLELVTHSENIKTSFTVGTNKLCVKVRRFCHDGTSKDFNSLADAEKETGVSSESIGAAVNGYTRTSGKDKNNFGYCWVKIVDGKLVDSQYENFYCMLSCMETAKKFSKIKVRAVFYDGNYKDFDSIFAASKAGIVGYSSINRVIKGERQFAGKDKNGYGIGWVLPSSNDPISDRYGSIEKMKICMEKAKKYTKHPPVKVTLFYENDECYHFKSMSKAAKETGDSTKKIRRCIDSKQKKTFIDENGDKYTWILTPQIV
uniref:HNH endonuclease n=1 Tax=Pithovirus LCPAC404 TaxID=2506597 RepID=A0A481ZD47_9VIRU|nr:MAG: HNH endonuclease [Pithovirus LCPAC404]